MLNKKTILCAVLAVSSFLQKYYKIIVEGVNDWSNMNSNLKHHESSAEHTDNMTEWREVGNRLLTR